MEGMKANLRQPVEMYNLNKELQGIRDSASAKVDSNVADARRLYAADAAKKQNKANSRDQMGFNEGGSAAKESFNSQERSGIRDMSLGTSPARESTPSQNKSMERSAVKDQRNNQEQAPKRDFSKSIERPLADTANVKAKINTGLTDEQKQKALDNRLKPEQEESPKKQDNSTKP